MAKTFTWNEYQDLDDVEPGSGNGTLYTYDSSADSYSSDLSGSINFDYFPDNISAGDAIYFELHRYTESSPNNFRFYIGTPISADSISVVWEFWDGSSWQSLSNLTDETNAFQNSGQQDVTFDCPYTDISSTTINGDDRNWIRVRVESVTNPSEGGAQSTQKVKTGNSSIVASGGTSSDPVTLDDIYEAGLTMINGDNPLGKINPQGVSPVFAVNNDFGGLYIHDYFEMDGESFHGPFGIDGDATAALDSARLFAGNCTFAGGRLMRWYGDITINNSHFKGNWIYFRGKVTSNKSLWEGPSIFVGYDDQTWNDCIVNIQLKVNSVSGELTFNRDYFANPISQVTPYDDGSSLVLYNPIIFDGGRLATWEGQLKLVNPIFGGSYSVDNTTSSTENYETWIRFYYTFERPIQDKDGNAIEGAKVSIENTNGTEVANYTTNSNGLPDNIPELITDEWKDDPEIYTEFNPFTLRISKSGYETIKTKFTLDKKAENIITLEHSPYQVEI